MAFDPKDPETKKALDDAIAKAVNSVKEDIEGLKQKNYDLKGELIKAKKGQDVDPADHAALEKELEEAQDKLKAAEKTAKTATKEAEEMKKSYEGESKVVRDLLVDNGLSSALLGNGIKNPSYLKAAKALLASQVTLEVDGDKRVAKVGDKALADHIKEWAGSDEGKAFVDAKVNSGGGGGFDAGGNGGEAKTMPRSKFEALPATDRTGFISKGGTLTDE